MTDTPRPYDHRDIAGVCYEATRAFCGTHGDESIPPWDVAPDHQRQRVIKEVQYLLQHPDIEPNDSDEDRLFHAIVRTLAHLDTWTNVEKMMR